MRVLSIGECMVELRPVSVNEPNLLRSGFAGDTMNTAWYLAQLQPGWDIQYLTHVGNDRLSNQMVAFLQSSRIGTECLVRRDDATVGMYLIETDDHGERSFLYWRNQSASRHLADDFPGLASALHDTDVVYFSGITLAILPNRGRANLMKALSGLDRENIKVVFDPNLRPQLWESPDIMRKSITEAASLSSIVLPSFEDEAAIFGDASPDETITRYQAGGPAEVVVKNGEKVIRACNLTNQFEHWPNAVPVVDSTAAGDSFNAGYLSARLSGATLPDALAAGSRVSASVVQASGALVKLPST